MSFDGKLLQFARPFIDASKNVFETMVFTKIEPQKPTLKKEQTSSGDIASIMGITGSVQEGGANRLIQGMFILSWPELTYLKIAGSMLGETYTSIGPNNMDAGAEINNMVTGNAKRVFAETGFKIDMAIPTTIVGKNQIINYPSRTAVISIPVKCSLGDFHMEICLNVAS